MIWHGDRGAAEVVRLGDGSDAGLSYCQAYLSRRLEYFHLHLGPGGH